MTADEMKATWELYVTSWKVATSEEKRALYERCLVPNCVYTDPLTRAQGWDALLAYMVDFHRQIPGGHFVMKDFSAHHGRSLAHWNLVDGQGVVRGDGVSYGEYGEQGKLAAMTGFFEVPNS